jgi:hypothetical protein
MTLSSEALWSGEPGAQSVEILRQHDFGGHFELSFELHVGPTVGSSLIGNTGVPVSGLSREVSQRRSVSYTVSSRYSPISPTTTITARNAFGDNRRP